MVTVHLTTDSEPGLRGEAQGLAAIRRPCELLRGGAGDAESSSALAADPDRARARCAGRDGLGPVGSTSSGGGRAPASAPSRVRSLGGFGVNRSSPGCDGRSLGRTQGASISVDMGATEDSARGRAARPGDTDCFAPNPPSWRSRPGRRGASSAKPAGEARSRAALARRSVRRGDGRPASRRHRQWRSPNGGNVAAVRVSPQGRTIEVASAADLTSAFRRGGSTAQSRAGETAGPGRTRRLGRFRLAGREL